MFRVNRDLDDRNREGRGGDSGNGRQIGEGVIYGRFQKLDRGFQI